MRGEESAVSTSAHSGLVRRVGGILAGCLVAGFLVWGVAGGWSKAARYHWHVDPLRLALALVLLTGFNLAWGIGYAGLLAALGGRAAGSRRALSIWARSLLGRYIPGNVVMFAGRVILGREAGIPGHASLAASVYEQVAMLVPAALAGTAFLVVAGAERFSPLFWLTAAVPLAAALLDPAVLGAGGNRLLRRLRRETIVAPLARLQVLAALAWFALAIVLFGLGTGLSIQAVAGTRAGGLLYLSSGFLLAWVLSMVAFIFPSGLGVREGVLAVVVGRHIPSSAAVSVAAASRLLLTAVELAVVGLLVVRGRAAG